MKNRNFTNLNINPCKMCMPMGAAIAFRGIENSMMMLHGSQGCSAYMRTHLTTHFSEPIDIASSSLHENATIYGGADNLKKGLKNLIQLYGPKVIGISTTCLAETIGEDIKRIAAEFKAENDVSGINIITTNTPGYGGTLYEGYFTALNDIVKQVAKQDSLHNKINIIMPYLAPGDVRNIKGMLESFDIEYIMLPDISKTFDAPFSKEFKKIPEGGTKYDDIEAMSGAKATLEVGATVPDSISPGKYLLDEFNVPLYRCPIPVGVENTDHFVKILSSISQRAIPERFPEERGRLIDGMIDAHKLSAGIKALIYGDPDLIYAVSCLCLENGMNPSIISTGTHGSILRELLSGKIGELEEKPLILDETDFETIEKHALERKVNLIIGNSGGKQITEKYGIPPVRIGFPIQDRYGGQRLVYTGYSGSLKLLDDICNTMLAGKFGMHRKIMLERYFHKE
ncbi:MAG: nitrogenase component 1 [Candidatus Omnitrophota bacterium]|jgi:nitrogenase molybdenum-iron protein NifN